MKVGGKKRKRKRKKEMKNRKKMTERKVRKERRQIISSKSCEKKGAERGKKNKSERK